MCRLLSLLLSVIILSGDIIAQEKEKERMKKGWTFGFFPAFGYDSNMGVKYGGNLKIFDYGDGTSYPRYHQSFYMEFSRTSRGTGVNQITYDTRKLIPGIRVMAEISYLTEKALNFYGFNGYNAFYNSSYTDPDDPLYRSSVFYHLERQMVKSKVDLIGKLNGNYLKWFAGIEYLDNKVDTVDINNINKGKGADDKLPSIGGGLYGNFIRWGIIPVDQSDGGRTTIFKMGLIYDSRERESNPMKGMWTELQLLLVPGFLSDGYSYSRLAFTHRHYLTIFPKRVNLLYRISFQAKLSGEMPFYMLPLVFNSAPSVTLSGLGGSRTIRGILRNRVVGEDFIYGNVELRWKLLQTVILNQNFYIALAGFTDAGAVTGKFKFADVSDPDGIAWLSQGEEEKPHITYGGGAHFAINDNFVISVDRGYAVDQRDGSKGTYIGLGYLF